MQSDSYSWIWTSGLTSTAYYDMPLQIQLKKVFSTLVVSVKDTWLQFRTHHRVVCIQANTERQPVSAGEHPQAHLLTADSADPGGNSETLCPPNQFSTH